MLKRLKNTVISEGESTVLFEIFVSSDVEKDFYVFIGFEKHYFLHD